MKPRKVVLSLLLLVLLVAGIGFVQGRIEAVFLTHFHSDHIDGLGELMMQRWVSTGNTAPVPVYGPPGVEQVVAGFRLTYTQHQHYRVAHHNVPALPLPGMEQAFLGNAANVFAGTIRVGSDGDFVSLPAGSSDIIVKRRF